MPLRILANDESGETLMFMIPVTPRSRRTKTGSPRLNRACYLLPSWGHYYQHSCRAWEKLKPSRVLLTRRTLGAALDIVPGLSAPGTCEFRRHSQTFALATSAPLVFSNYGRSPTLSAGTRGHTHTKTHTHTHTYAHARTHTQTHTNTHTHTHTQSLSLSLSH